MKNQSQHFRSSNEPISILKGKKKKKSEYIRSTERAINSNINKSIEIFWQRVPYSSTKFKLIQKDRFKECKFFYISQKEEEIIYLKHRKSDQQ